MDFVKAGNALQKFVYSIAGEEHRDLVTIAFGWKKIIGKLLAERTSIYDFDHNILFVTVSNNVWIQELVLHKSQIISDLNKELNVHISDIIFFLGKDSRQISIPKKI
ncbi:MAG: DUF721 domain-containing protein [Candidatus Cloacimonetes bacterium]|nr:DUF721 domain-containing protein [Candidatus Cloacimonadota bacterium]